MNPAELAYPDTATFYRVSSAEYGNNKVIEEQENVPVIFLQSTGFARVNFRESVTADAICYPDPENDFIVDNNMRLEGMYILAPLFDVADSEGWYKVETAIVNRDHLLENRIDNVQLILKKTRPVLNVS